MADGIATASTKQMAHDQTQNGAPLDSVMHPDVDTQRSRDVLIALIGLRLVNALTLATFFQPDEYYQALEPAWRMTFGGQSGAWITWEWDHQLRSAIYPSFISGLYHLANGTCWLLSGPPTLRTQLLILLPKVGHAGLAALTDYSAWQLGERLYGRRSRKSSAMLLLITLSLWQWFVSTRSLVNGLETTLTTAALVRWPWSWGITSASAKERQRDSACLKYCIFFAATAVMLRPTNLIIWATLSLFTLPCATQDEFIGLVRDASLWGSAVLMLSSCVDRLYYGDWVFPAANFLRYNLSQGLATFYGINRADYYLTEGLPILLTTILPFTFVGIVQRIGSHSAAPALKHLAITVLVYVAVLSCVSHKEARFLYPVIAPALALAAGPFSDFFAPLARQRSAWRGSLALLMVITTLTIAVYTSRVHNRGVISVMSYLRGQFHAANPDLVLGRIQQPTLESALFGTSRNQSALQPIDVGFLMPCHSTPWRSHLIYPEVEAWALTCEPPIGLSPREREQYKDEADIFYENPVSWMETHMGPILTESEPRAATAIAVSNKADSMKQWMDTKAWKGRRPWPRYVVFFAQLEPDIKTVLGREGSRYAECWRGFNSHWHDDWRRQGDVVVWCLDGSLDLDEALGDEAGMFD